MDKASEVRRDTGLMLRDEVVHNDEQAYMPMLITKDI